MSYLLIKWVHIVSATILFGAGIGSAFYMFLANRQTDIKVIYFATRTVVLTDFIFTTPAIIVQLITGVLLVEMAGYAYSDIWILGGISLYFFAGLCWLPVVWMQIKMRNMAKISLDNNTLLPALYWKLNRWWIILGSLAFPAVMIIFYLMVFKI